PHLALLGADDELVAGDPVDVAAGDLAAGLDPIGGVIHAPLLDQLTLDDRDRVEGAVVVVLHDRPARAMKRRSQTAVLSIPSPRKVTFHCRARRRGRTFDYPEVGEGTGKGAIRIRRLRAEVGSAFASASTTTRERWKWSRAPATKVVTQV